jgi:hypothetical protein
MATAAELDRIARALPGVTVGKYWGDEGAYLFPGRGGRGLVGRRPPRRDEGTVDPGTDEPYTDLLVVYTATPEAHDEALAAFPEDVVFTIPHFKRSNAVLAHLDRITPADLEDLLDLAHRSKRD